MIWKDLYTRMRSSSTATRWIIAAGIIVFLISVILIGQRLSVLEMRGSTTSDEYGLTFTGWSTFIKMMLAVGTIGLSLHLFQRWRTRTFDIPEKTISLLETQRLSQRQAIHLVRAGSHLLLLGATDNGVRLLCELDSACNPLPSEDDPPLQLDFTDLLHAARHRFSGSVPRPEEAEESTPDLESSEDENRGLTTL